MSGGKPDGAPIRVVTWNVHGAVGGDRRCEPARVLAAIRRLRPDVLALQEVDGRTQFGREARAFETFADALGGHCVEARLTGRPGREAGHLLWSRWPLAGSAVHPLPGGGIEPRAAIDARIQTPQGVLRVLAAHFGLSPRARRAQGAFLADLVCPAEPTLAVGDLNEWRSGGPVHRRLVRVLPVHPSARTWPARRPLVALDRFYASADLRILAASADREAATASDHLPLVVDVSLAAR